METDLRHHLRIIRKRWWIIVLAAGIAAALSFLQLSRATPLYSAQAKISVGLERIGQGGLPVAATDQNPAELISTYAAMIETRPVVDNAIKRAGIPLSVEYVKGRLKATQMATTRLLAITFQSPDPELAARTANAVAEAFKAQVEDTSGGRQPPTRIEVIEPAAVPGSPEGASRTQTMAVALVLGMAIGVGAVYLVEALDVTIKSREQIEALGLPAIGGVPVLETSPDELYLDRDPQGMGGEAFRKLRTAIGFMSLETPVQIILVTSPFAGEGKTTVALNLAAAYAQSGLRVCLVEADLRRPSFHKLFRGYETNGLTTAIIGEVGLEEAIFPTGISNLSVMLAGAIPPNPVELLDSSQMLQILQRLRGSFDIIVLDAPPMVPVADPAALASRSDGVLVVVQAGSTHRRPIVEAAALIERAGGRLLGVLLNRTRPETGSYEYEYYYSYRSSHAPTKTGGS